MKLEQIGFYSLTDERAKNVTKNSQMKRCEMIITEKCNFKCPYCRGLKSFIYEDRKNKGLTLSEIKNNIDFWCKDMPLENIRFSGGEPTLHKDIVEIISYAKYKKIKRIAVSSNGSNKTELYDNLISAGVNDFSISLDACCSDDGDLMSGGVKGSWNIVIKNIKHISSKCYTTVGVVLTPKNIDKTIDTIKLAHNLGVSDIRIITASRYNKPIPRLNEVPEYIKKAHPILSYRINHFAKGINVRGIKPTDSHKCAIVLDDSIIAGSYHFPCVIYMRESGQPIGKVNDNMREERYQYFKNHDTHKDMICKKNCLDVCIDHNNKVRDIGEKND